MRFDLLFAFVGMERQKYLQKYRIEWERNDDFKSWLAPCENNTIKAYCKYCKCTFFAKLSDIQRHIKTLKHKENSHMRTYLI